MVRYMLKAEREMLMRYDNVDDKHGGGWLVPQPPTLGGLLDAIFATKSPKIRSHCL